MTHVGSGGVVVRRWRKGKTFHREYGKLTIEQKDLFEQKLQDLILPARPPGLRFEKLKGYSDPDLYTIHLDGNYKVSFEIDGDIADFRRIGPHDDIDRSP